MTVNMYMCLFIMYVCLCLYVCICGVHSAITFTSLCPPLWFFPSAFLTLYHCPPPCDVRASSLPSEIVVIASYLISLHLPSPLPFPTLQGVTKSVVTSDSLRSTRPSRLCTPPSGCSELQGRSLGRTLLKTFLR